MKKNLLLGAALFAASFASAQVEVQPIDVSGFTFTEQVVGTNKDGTDKTAKVVSLTAGSEISSSASVKASVVYEDLFQNQGLGNNDVKVNGEEMATKGCGLQGNANPEGTAASVGTYPTKGCIYRFVPSKDGYLYIIHKASANKNYVVWEEKSRIPYYFSMQDDKATNPGITYDLNKIDSLVTTTEGITTVNEGVAIVTPGGYAGASGDAAKISGTGVIEFPVYEGLEYDVHATGSKLTLAGFVFSTTEDVTIETTTEGNANVLCGDGTTGINKVSVDAEGNISVPAYNIAGQRVSKDTKGLVIVGGKKYLNK